jgi:hypothetical protein
MSRPGLPVVCPLSPDYERRARGIWLGRSFRVEGALVGYAGHGKPVPGEELIGSFPKGGHRVLLQTVRPKIASLSARVSLGITSRFLASRVVDASAVTITAASWLRALPEETRVVP